MIVSHEREKLIQIVAYFAAKVKKLGKVKLFKLLYFLDFQHYRDTGRSVTGMEYFAWPKGPVPVDLYNELDAPKSDWDGHVTFTKTPVRGRSKPMLLVRALSKFDSSHFSRRELRLMEGLAREFRDTDAEDMIEATHLENLPWHKVFETEAKPQQLIPYAYSVRAQESGEIGAAANERAEMLESLKKEE